MNLNRNLSSFVAGIWWNLPSTTEVLNGNSVYNERTSLLIARRIEKKVKLSYLARHHRQPNLMGSETRVLVTFLTQQKENLTRRKRSTTARSLNFTAATISFDYDVESQVN